MSDLFVAPVDIRASERHEEREFDVFMRKMLNDKAISSGKLSELAQMVADQSRTVDRAIQHAESVLLNVMTTTNDADEAEKYLDDRRRRLKLLTAWGEQISAKLTAVIENERTAEQRAKQEAARRRRTAVVKRFCEEYPRHAQAIAEITAEAAAADQEAERVGLPLRERVFIMAGFWRIGRTGNPLDEICLPKSGDVDRYYWSRNPNKREIS